MPGDLISLRQNLLSIYFPTRSCVAGFHRFLRPMLTNAQWDTCARHQRAKLSREIAFCSTCAFFHLNNARLRSSHIYVRTTAR